MLRNVRTPKLRKPVMVLLHGSGSSASIFGIQTHLLTKELSKHYDLIFLDGPNPSPPGPGVLPLFADMPGYYRWLSPQLCNSLRLAELLAVARYIDERLAEQGIKPSEVVAFLGFSQGAMVALSMLALRQIGISSWENLRFCVMIGAGTTGNVAQMDGVEQMMQSLASMLGRKDGKFPGYSVQAAGLRDVWYKDGRRLAGMCAKDTTRTLDYRDGHVVPRQKNEVLKLLQMIKSVDKDSSQNKPMSLNGTEPPFKDAIASFLEGDKFLENTNLPTENIISV